MGGQIIPLYPDSGTDAARLQGFPVSVTDPTSGDILVYDSATRQWVPRSKAAAGLAELAGGTFSGNVTLNGTANTAPNQTAASGSSLMTRDLGDARYGGEVSYSVLTADVTYNSNATPANVTGFSYAMTAGLRYRVELVVGMTHTTNCGSKWDLFYTGIINGNRTIFLSRGYSNSAWLSYGVVGAFNNSTSTGGSTSVINEAGGRIDWLAMPSTDGTLTLRASQNVSHPDTTTLRTGTFWKITKLP